nr:hypothetical protein [Alteromonas macleodii]
MNDLSFTIKPKSDQLNADDLIAGPITVTVQAVNVYESPDQPVSVVIGNGCQPYKPCKSMRRLMIAVWGKHDSDWIGQSMTLFNDPSVTWAGAAVGGIRISHMTGLTKPFSVALTATRGKRKPYTVEPLQLPAYPVESFEQNKAQWAQLISDGKYTPNQIIQGCQQKGLLTEQQKTEILNMAQPEPQASDDEDM